MASNRGDKTIVEIFAGWKARNGYDHDQAARAAGFSSYKTWKRRLGAPETLTVKELRRLVEITRATDEDIIRMVTGRRRT